MKSNEFNPPSTDEIAYAAELLRSGKLVAFPTETVYGLGANALDAVAVARIFEVKGRPNTSPVIVHVSDHGMVARVVASWPDKARILAEHFWPGPLTLVLPKTPAVPDIVTAGLPTVGVRMPAHPIALALIAAAHVPVAAPSANRFAQISPTTAEHVRLGLGDRVDFILDGGPCTVGIESTVLSLVEDVPVLLRPGGISRQQIEAVIGEIASAQPASAGAHASPGMHPRHYSPRTPLFLVRDGHVPAKGSGAYLQLRRPPRESVSEVVVMPDTAADYASRLYSILHALDVRGYDWIAVETPGPGAEWEAVLDRLSRAAASRP
ncbi:MAG: L-threonylcarbamoyladenylate synthase [Candidatus Korobacteraceae bacterium]